MSKELTTKQTTALAVPDFLKDDEVVSGFDGLDEKDEIMPRVNLVQPGSTEAKQRIAEPGTFHNSLTEINYGENVEVIFIGSRKGAVYLTMGEGMKCRSDDRVTNIINGGKCSECWLNEYFDTWKDKTPPKCSKTIDLIGVIRSSLASGTPEVVVFTFRRGAFDIGKNILKRGVALRKSLFAQAYILGSEYVKHPKGDHYGYTVKHPGWVTQQEYEACQKLATMFANRVVRTDEDAGLPKQPAATTQEEDLTESF